MSIEYMSWTPQHTSDERKKKWKNNIECIELTHKSTERRKKIQFWLQFTLAFTFSSIDRRNTKKKKFLCTVSIHLKSIHTVSKLYRQITIRISIKFELFFCCFCWLAFFFAQNCSVLLFYYFNFLSGYECECLINSFKSQIAHSMAEQFRISIIAKVSMKWKKKYNKELKIVLL